MPNAQVPAIEVYKSVLLTIIALALVALYLKTPKPATLEDVRSNRVKITEIPLVRVQGGFLQAEVTGTVGIDR